jgi:hypothetical protein
MVADGLEEGFTGFQLFKSAAPNSSMAISYEHLIFCSNIILS